MPGRSARGRMGTALVVVLLVALSLGVAQPALAAGVVGAGTPESCTEGALLAALDGGGVVTFSCGTAPATINLSTRLQITGIVTIDGDDLVTLSGGGTTGLFDIAPGATLELREITLTRGADRQGEGGAVRNAGTLRLLRATLTGNNAYRGGGIFNAGGSVDIRESSLEGNGAGFGGGGGAFNDGGTLTIERGTLAGNMSARHGGGVFTRAGALSIVNSTFSGNGAAMRGGGLYHAGPAEIAWSTFAGNTASFDDGGNIYSLGPLTWGNSIFAAGSPRNCGGLGAYTSHGYSISSDTSCPTEGVGDRGNLDPRLGPLLGNGGPTRTHALFGGSPARDNGDPATCPPTDQRGVPRPIDGNGDGLAVCDAGALEAPPNIGPSVPGAPALSSDSTTPNRGVFTLLWSPATDPQGDPLTYTLLHKEAGQAEYSLVATGISSNAWSFTESVPEAEGVWTYIVRAGDGASESGLSAPSEAVTVTLDPLGTTIGIPGRRPRPPQE